MKKEKIFNLIEHYYEFEKECPESDLLDFASWILKREMKPKTNLPTKTTVIERSIMFYINRLSKFSKFWSRKALSKHGMISMDDFYFMLTIAKLDNPTKSEVYRDTVTELSTGSQIMRRLIHLKFVQDTPDETDNRAKRVKLTTKGKSTLESILNDFEFTVKLKTLNLDYKTKTELMNILRSLNLFHTRMYQQDSDKTIEELLEKYKHFNLK